MPFPFFSNLVYLSKTAISPLISSLLFESTFSQTGFYVGGSKDIKAIQQTGKFSSFEKCFIISEKTGSVTQSLYKKIIIKNVQNKKKPLI